MKSGRILVVGGGIGGLTAAAALGQKGFEVTVAERSDGTGVEGVGISQQANVVRALASLGLAEEYLSAGFAYEAVEIYAPDGALIARVPSRSLIEGYPASLGIPRPALHKVLHAAASATGAVIRNSAQVAEMVPSAEEVGVILTDGSSGHYDAVVGADGIYSQMRHALFPEVPPPQFTGQAVWRYNLPRPPDFDALHVYNGPTGVGLVPMSQTQIYIYATTPEPANPAYSVEGLAARMRERLSGCAPQIQEIAARIVDDAAVVYRPLEAIFLDGPWYKGRVALLGDAVHATTPHLGQGGGMAIEDAIVIAEELSRHDTPQQAFAAYRQRRVERCRYVVEKSLEICRGQLGQGPLIDNARASAEMNILLAQPI
uniref:FAD-dependent monooxygenase n=1 Tax=Altererythrobacter segetis TaxID=1104773 RepID=UPI001407EF78|nr:FAD-dependent monooxygenase [Altererythrobacter segetis]